MNDTTSTTAAEVTNLDPRNIQERIFKLIKDQVNVPEVQLSSSLVDDLGFDSLDGLEVVMAIEEEFDFEISDEDAERFETVQQLVDYVKAHLPSIANE